MICSRCAHWNNEDEHRCTKCAARLNDRQVESAFHTSGALALQAMPRETPFSFAMAAAGPALEVANGPENTHGRIPRYVTSLQQSLFAIREGGRVVSIDGLEPERPQPRKHATSSQRRRQATASYLPQQGVLEFVPMASPQARKLATSVDARIFCEQPVASVSHRLFGGLYDLGFISVFIMAFLGIIYWGCDDLAASLSDPLSGVLLTAGAVVIGLLYHTIFLAIRGETPGMRFAGLKLVDFDGRDTTEEQLQMRILGAFFSVLPAGMGLLWALLDEESLTWQDHISHTFPTPVTSE